MAELKANIGVYTDPAHNLWIDPASPSVEEIKSGSTLEKGEVVVAIRSTGICGYVLVFREIDGGELKALKIGYSLLACGPDRAYDGRARQAHPRPRIRRRGAIHHLIEIR